MDVNALLKALQTTLRFEQEMASRFGAPTPAPAPPVRRDSGRESDHAFPYSSGVQREPETEVRHFSPTLHDYLLSFFVTHALLQYFSSYLSLSPSSSSLSNSTTTSHTIYPLLSHPLFKVETERRLKNQDKLLYVPTDHGKEISDDELETTYLRNAQVYTYNAYHYAIEGMVKSRNDVDREVELLSVVLFLLM